jgi:6-phosphogluconolactonase
VILRAFESATTAAAGLAEQVAMVLQLGLSLRDEASLALPGGRTPVPLFHALREVALDWARVLVTLTDERCVPTEDAASNAALLRDHLFAGRAVTARFVSLYDGGVEGDAAASRAWERLRIVPRPFDAVVLGMGEDGHFASLFAGNAGLAAALDAGAAPACVAMRAPVVPHERISMNLAALLQARRVFLFATGMAKRELLMAASRRDGGAKWPVAALLAQRRPMVEVFWAP